MLFSEMLDRASGERLAMADGRGSCTHGDFRGAVAGFAAHLYGLGLQKGDRVALWGYNSANWLIAFFAIVRAGGVAVLVNYSMDVKAASALLRRTGARFLVCGDNGQTKRWDDVMGTLADAAGVDRSHCVDIRAEVADLIRDYALADGLPEQRSAHEAIDTAFIIFTSGTTSSPKAVCVSQAALTADALALKVGLEGQMGPSICVSVPLFHILGLLTSYAYLCEGALVCLPDNYRAETLAALISVHRISDMAAVGAIYQGLVDAEDFGKRVVPHLHTCLIAGGMTTPVQMMRMELDFAKATFINMYGQSEGAPLTMVHPSDLVEQRAGTVGRAVQGVRLRIAGPGGHTLDAGEVGEVLACGACLMNGYEGLPANEQPIDDEGWLHTGDLGFLDAEGYLHLAGRLKDVIIRGGENISPSEIESEIISIDGVREAKVMGAPHPIFGESVEACVTMEKGIPFEAESILAVLRDRIPRYKVPSHIFGFDSFPLNENGKIDQRTLFATMVRRLRALAVDDELAGGITVFDITVKNALYAIEPVTTLVSSLADAVGFNRVRSAKLRLAVEEMLTERITDAYSAAGDIRVRITLLPDWLRISFSDRGTEYIIDKRRDTSMSARIILGSVDNFHTMWRHHRPIYCMDFLYDDYVDIKGFLLKSKEETEE